MESKKFEAKVEKALENILIQMNLSVEVDRKNIELFELHREMFIRIGNDLSDLQKNMKILIEENSKLKRMLGVLISVSDLDTKSRKSKIQKIKDKEPSLFSPDELHNDLPF